MPPPWRQRPPPVPRSSGSPEPSGRQAIPSFGPEPDSTTFESLNQDQAWIGPEPIEPSQPLPMHFGESAAERVASLLCVIVRDHMPVGAVQEAVEEAVIGVSVDPAIQAWAQRLARRLTE